MITEMKVPQNRVCFGFDVVMAFVGKEFWTIPAISNLSWFWALFLV